MAAKSTNTHGTTFWKELEEESPACRKCLERIPERLFDWKPHEKSASMGYLSLLVAEIPLWIWHMVERSEIDFATFDHFHPATTAQLVGHLDENLTRVRAALMGTSDAALAGPFTLKMNGKVLMAIARKDNIGSTIRHLVHHRGQLSVYMRMNDLPVPSIYGPSADERWY